MTTKTKTPAVGSTFHFVTTGLIWREKLNQYAALSSKRGQTHTVTAEMLEANRNGDGRSWLDLLGDDEAQLAKWGKVWARPGEAPSNLYPWTPGSSEEDDERERRRAEARRLPSEEAQRAALREIEKLFGNRKTSHTLRDYGGGVDVHR